jgi:hypothetical protein
MIKFHITRYDRRIKRPPFRHVKFIDSFELDDSFEDLSDSSGNLRYQTLLKECSRRGYNFHFYSTEGPGVYLVFVKESI